MEFNWEKVNPTDKNDKVETKKGPNSNCSVFGNNNNDFSGFCYEVFCDMSICFFDITAAEIQGNSSSYNKDLMQFNYCVEGRIELSLEDGFNVCLKEDDFCLSKQVSRTPFFFPTKKYKGISIYFNEKKFRLENAELLSMFELDFQSLNKKYLKNQSTVIMRSSNQLRDVMVMLWENRGNLSNFRIRHSALEIINILLKFKADKGERITYHTKTQAKIAKKAEKLLTDNIANHIPIKTVAEKYGISETSLKNYFKAVFGENISAYLRKYRMEKASHILLETKLSVGEISHLVGYTKQGKFAELFKKYYGYSPLEFRRIKFLENETG